MPKNYSDIDRKTASKILGVSVRTIDRYIRRGKLSVREEEGRIWLDKNDLMSLPKRITPMFKTPVDDRQLSPGFYKDLYEEARRAIAEYQQKLEQTNYRIGQLESQILQHSLPKSIERREEYPAERDLFKRELIDREKELTMLKELMKREKANRIIFALITYLLLLFIPLLWYLLR